MLERLRALTEGPFGVDLICATLPNGPASTEAHIDRCVELGVKLVAFHHELPPPRWVERLTAAGARVWQQASSLELARAAVALGMHGVVAQGSEAGGHCESKVPVLDLVGSIRQAFPELLILAAGGIVHGQQIRAALRAGADGVWVGTRLIASEEAHAHAEYKQRLVAAKGETVVTTAYGPEWPDRPYRVLPTRNVRQWAGREAAIPSPPPGPSVIGTTRLFPHSVNLEYAMPKFSAVVPTPATTGEWEEMAFPAGAGVGAIHACAAGQGNRGGDDDAGAGRCTVARVQAGEPPRWPGGARCAVTLTFDFDAESAWLSRDPNVKDRPGVLSQGRYGARVGVPRILALLRQYEIRATFFVPGVGRRAVSRASDVDQGCGARDRASRIPARTRDGRRPRRGTARVRARPRGAADRAGRPTGRVPIARLGPDTAHARPRPRGRHAVLQQPDGRRVAIPAPPPAGRRGRAARPVVTRRRAVLHVQSTLCQSADRVADAGALGVAGRVTRASSSGEASSISRCIPQIIGHPARLRMLRRLIEVIKGLAGSDVWLATCEDVARHWLESERR